MLATGALHGPVAVRHYASQERRSDRIVGCRSFSSKPGAIERNAASASQGGRCYEVALFGTVCGSADKQASRAVPVVMSRRADVDTSCGGRGRYAVALVGSWIGRLTCKQ